MRGGDGLAAGQLGEGGYILYGNALTGQCGAILASATGTVSDAVDGRARISVDIDLAEYLAIADDRKPECWRNSLTFVAGGGWVQASGPITSWSWRPDGVTLTADGGEVWWGRTEVMPPAALGTSLMTATVKARGERTTKTRTEWTPDTAARISYGYKTPQAHAASLMALQRVWAQGGRQPSMQATHYSTGTAGTAFHAWDGIDHKTLDDALADVLAGREYRLDPYWSDPANLVVGYDLLIGDPTLIRDDVPVGWGTDSVELLSVERDGTGMSTVSQAVARGSDGMAINRTAQAATSLPLLMRSQTASGDASTSAEVQGIADAGLRASESTIAKVRMPLSKASYLLLGSLHAGDWLPDAAISGQYRLTDYTVDLGTQMLTATITPAGSIRGRR